MVIYTVTKKVVGELSLCAFFVYFKAEVKKLIPLFFEYALGWPKPKENSIMIGDSLDADVQGALDMGLIFLMKKRPHIRNHIKQNHLLN
jgi:putative hydrolase of the HAD superfamily